jgi:hypothetical protein
LSRLTWPPLGCTLPACPLASAPPSSHSSSPAVPDPKESADPTSDESCEPSVWYSDADGDGWGAGPAAEACEAPDGFVDRDGDCDETDPTVYPGADEYCDDVDRDCDGQALDDDAVDALTWYADLDGDGYGDPLSATTACLPPEGLLADASDCDDLDPAVHPDADEVCDGIDNNCNGLVDDDDPEVLSDGMSTWYVDADGDGYGVPGETVLACAAPEGFAASDEDCDDEDPGVYPGAGTWQVPGDFDTIQEAIDAACTLDWIEVEAGSYEESLDFGEKALHLRGAGAELTRIDGGAGGAPTLSLRSGSVEGLAITNGSAPRGAGLYASGGDWLVLSELQIHGNEASERGGGLLIEEIGLVELADLEIYDNSVVSDGGGAWISVPEGGSLEGSRLEIRDNTSGQSDTVRGGGLYLEATGPARLSELTLSGNRLPTTSMGYGGGIYVDGEADLSGATVSDNSAYGYHAYGGGVYAAGTVDLSGATFSGNFASGSNVGYGGGVYATGTVDLSGALIQDNSTHAVNASRGAGVYASGTVDLAGATVVENLAYSNWSGWVAGAGVYATGAVSLVGATVSRNTASTDYHSDGIGVYSSGTVDLSGATVADNDSSACGTTTGGGVYAGGTVDLTGARITGNIGASYYSSSYVLGGGVIVDGEVIFSGTVVSGNTTAAEGTVWGGVYVDHPEGILRLQDSVIAGNSGTGIHIWVEEETAEVELLNMSIVGNGGDGVGVEASWEHQVALRNVIVAQNLGYGVAVGARSEAPTVSWSNLSSSRLRSIQAFFSWTCMRWVRRSAVGSSWASSTTGKIDGARCAPPSPGLATRRRIISSAAVGLSVGSSGIVASSAN